MPNKYSLELSDVQLKVIKELDVLTDAFVSTFNEFGKIIKAYSEGISVIIEKFLKEKNYWRPYDTQCFDLSYMPFREEYAFEKKFSIGNLQQYLCVAGQRTLVKEVIRDRKKEQVDEQILSWGFIYDFQEEPNKIFYVEVQKGKSSGGANLSKKEYIKLANDIKKSVDIKEDNFYTLDHPDDGYPEFFSVWLDFEKYPNKLPEFFQICKDELIEKFLSKIKD